MCWIDLGMIPLSEYFSAPPVIVKVLPEPVYVLERKYNLSICKDRPIVALDHTIIMMITLTNLEMTGLATTSTD